MGRRDSQEQFAMGVIVGLLLGVVLGILVAPQSGARTRKRIAEEASRAAAAARDLAEMAEHAAGSITGRVEHYLGRDEQLAWRKIQEIRDGVQRLSEEQHPTA
jgi:gas vesicle protein